MRIRGWGWVAFGLAATAHGDDPRISSWLTRYSGQYARIFQTDAELAIGTGKTTWAYGSITQALPAYCGVQEVAYSTNWIYLRTTGLGTAKMGPWYLGTNHTTLFPNLPKNQAVYYRLPRSVAVASNKTLTALGAIGYFVDGVSMFDSSDGYIWNGTAEANTGTGYWTRDAYVNEGATFDPAMAHQPGNGQYHYHANPIALRYLLGDNISYSTNSRTYSENTAVTNPPHSPILGWVSDGSPIYGPYGYANTTNPAAGTRRLVSGYVLRNGQYGTQNLSVTGRTNLPAWAVRRYGVSAAQSGPTNFTTYPLGRYMEDREYLGDLGYTQGVDFDLDEHNGRFSVTPEYPEGIYAYFVSITSNGTPAFPYNIGRAFHGVVTGGAISSAGEAVVTNFVNGRYGEVEVTAPVPAGGLVTLTWSALEGGTYRVETSSNLTAWSVAASNVTPGSVSGAVSVAAASGPLFTRVTRTALATYDTAGSTSSEGILSITPSSGNRGSAYPFTLALDTAASIPPTNAPIVSLTIGANTVTGATRPSQYVISGTFTIPAGAVTGAQTVTVIFPGPPGNPTAYQTNRLANGFTIN